MGLLFVNFLANREAYSLASREKQEILSPKFFLSPFVLAFVSVRIVSTMGLKSP